MKTKKPLKTFKDAVVFFDGARNTATKLDISLASVYFYINGERKISPEIAAKVDVLTNGHVSRKDLFPKNWMVIWPELKAAA